MGTELPKRPSGKLMCHVVLAIADLERDSPSKRGDQCWGWSRKKEVVPWPLCQGTANQGEGISKRPKPRVGVCDLA